MPRHPTARRVHRAPEAPDDAFVAGVLETSAWAKKHGRVIIIGAIVFAVLVGGFLWYRSQRAATRERAAIELTQVRQAALMGNYALAVRDLESFVQRYDGTPAAREARVLLGQAHLELGQPEPALQAVEPLARDPRAPLGASAAFLMAAAHEAAGRPDQAEEAYLRIADRGAYLYERLEAFDNAARLRLDRGDAAGAVELYDRAVQSIPDERAQDRAVFEMRRAEAEALAGAGVGS
jgi:predicted negative regulator of RcsB-dependent stress response